MNIRWILLALWGTLQGGNAWRLSTYNDGEPPGWGYSVVIQDEHHKGGSNIWFYDFGKEAGQITWMPCISD